jgi:hypothetical protein
MENSTRRGGRAVGRGRDEREEGAEEEKDGKCGCLVRKEGRER